MHGELHVLHLLTPHQNPHLMQATVTSKLSWRLLSNSLPFLCNGIVSASSFTWKPQEPTNCLPE